MKDKFMRYTPAILAGLSAIMMISQMILGGASEGWLIAFASWTYIAMDIQDRG